MTKATLKPAPAPPVTETYQPLSLLAIVGFGWALASLFMFFFEEEKDMPKLFFLPLPALIIALVARRRIRRSDGTLAGDLIATAGIVFSLISGLGWTTRYATTSYVLRQESTKFLDEWMAKLRAGNTVAAFLDLVDPELRIEPQNLQHLRNHYADSNGSSRYDRFRGARFLQMVLRSGEQVHWEHQGQEWIYHQGSYTVIHYYSVRTPEQEGDLVIRTKSTKNRKGDGPPRLWRLENWDDAGMKPTAYGLALERAKREVQDTIFTWLNHLRDGQWGEALNMLALTAEDRRDLAVAHALCLSSLMPNAAAITPARPVLSLGVHHPASANLKRFNELCVTLYGPGFVPTMAPPIIVRYQQGGKSVLDFEAIISKKVADAKATRELEFRITISLQKGNAPTPNSGWQIVAYDYELLGEAKRQAVALTPAMPTMPGLMP